MTNPRLVLSGWVGVVGPIQSFFLQVELVVPYINEFQLDNLKMLA